MHSLAVFFEDLVSNPSDECKKLFKHLDIPLEHVPAALDALKQDSQKGTFGPRGKRPRIDEKELAGLEAFLQNLGGDPRLTCHMSLESYKSLILSKINE